MKNLGVTRLILSQGPRTTSSFGPGYDEPPPSSRRPPESSPHSPGASSSASNHRASRPSAAAALSRAGSVACYAVVTFLVGFAVLLALALPHQAQAQTTVKMVGNGTGSLTYSYLGTNFDGDYREVAQRFTTGSNTGGYTLSTAAIWFGALPTNAADITNFVAAIYTSTSNKPGTLKYTLTNPSGNFATTGRKDFSAPAASTLDAGTKYWLVLKNDNATDGENVTVNSTASGEDGNSLAGWSIQDQRYQRVSRSGSWTSSASQLQIRISGYANASDDATLSALALATGSAASVALSPTFLANSTAYRAFVQNDTDAITLTATKNDDGATVMISGDTDTTTPGTASVALSEGANTITITVTAEDGLTTRTYTITVARAASAPTADPGAVWTANLTVAVNGTVVGYNKTAGTGALAPRLLMVGESTFTVTQVEYNALSSSLPIGFEEWFILDALAYLARWGVVLHLGDVVLDFRDGFPSMFVLDWEFGDVVLLKLFTNTPDKVTGVQVTTGNKQLDVEWEKPRAAEGYKVQWKSGSQTFADAATGGREATIADEDITTYTIPNLTNGTEYMIRVIATNDAGDGDPSDVQSGIPGTTPTLSIADASAAENAGHLLFEVTLSRSLRNTVKVDFATISGGTATEGEDYHARRTYTHVIPAGETTAQMGFALIEDMIDDAGETVKVELSNARVVDAYGDKIKDLNITTAEATGTIDAPLTTTADVPGLTIGIQDATGDEDDGWLDFKVRLSRKLTDYVCYDFETISGGTATEGTDYVKRPKVGQWIRIGKRVDKPFVRIIDDSMNDNGETVKVKISNARLCDDASQTVSITRAEATGTIRNSDPLPQALLARFGRTAAVHVVEHVEERIRARRTTGMSARLAGRELRPGMTDDVSRGLLRQLGDLARSKAPVDEGNYSMAGFPGMDTGSDVSFRTTGHTGVTPIGVDPHSAATGPNWIGYLQRGFGVGGLLTGSSFELNRETGRGGMLSFWSRGARSQFTGREDRVTLDGRTATTMAGADYRKGRLVAGLSLAHSRGQGDYKGVDVGALASSLTGLYPWLGYQATKRITVWGVTGFGKGSLRLTPGTGDALETGLSMAMAATGMRGELVAPVMGGFGMAFKADALWVATSNAGLDGPAGSLAATRAVVTRLRAGLEASRGYDLRSGLSLQPSMEVGLRQDDGNAETGAGVDVAGGLIFSIPSRGIKADLRVRSLIMHQDQDYRERGVLVSFSYDPKPSTPLGMTVSVAPSWGGQTRSGAEALWSRETMEGLGGRRPEAGARFDTELAYGLPVGGRLVGTPLFGIRTSATSRYYQLGYRLAVLQRSTMNFELGVAAQHRESLVQGTVDRGVTGRVTMTW